MVQEELVSDLEIIDYLELFNSTVESAKKLQISQSSCSRRYRSFSERYGIGFDRIGDRYQPTDNLDVLSSLRQASQKLRVRQGSFRICLGWQLGDIEIRSLQHGGILLPLRPMNSWRLLSMLEQRLVDVAIMGLLEFQSLLGHPLKRLRARRMPLSPTMQCVPIGLFDLKVLAHHSHPLQGLSDLTPETLAPFPSPALPLGMAPTLIGALQNHGLANQACGLTEYQEQGWEGFARDGIGLSYGAPHQLPSLDSRYGLQALNYDLGITECFGVVGHRDVLSDAGFPTLFKQSVSFLHRALNGSSGAIRWLS